MLAIKENYNDIVTELLRCKADHELEDYLGRDAYSYALKYSNQQALDQLFLENEQLINF